jgi:uncharacterized protein (TIGR03083 family)
MVRNDFGYVDTILHHSAGLANAARDCLSADVEHCPGWSVADLVHHLTDVHWFWATIAEERLSEPPDESRRPPRVPAADLVLAFEAGATRLAEVLRRTPYRDRCWTWAPAQQDVGFVARHQVQEAAVHHWDAANAAGSPWAMNPAVAADCIDEFLTFAVSSDDDVASSARPSLGGSFAVRAVDSGDRWTISDGKAAGTVRFTDGADDQPGVDAPAADLLLWLYDRKPVDTTGIDSGLLERFRNLCFTT